MAVTRADNASARIAAGHPRPLIPIPSKGGVEFGFQKLLDEAANARAHPTFQRIEPIIAKKMLAFRGEDRWLCAICCHGVISVGALTPILVCFHKLEITPPSNSNHSRYATDCDTKGQRR
jgi:hypothetical protein